MPADYRGIFSLSLDRRSRDIAGFPLLGYNFTCC